MRKLGASILKELQLLIHDKVGLILMYLMPVVLVFIITIVQDSAFKLVNDNKLELLVANKDQGTLGDTLISMLEKSGNFNLEKQKNLSESQMQKIGLSSNKLASIYIPENFSAVIKSNTGSVTKLILMEFGVADDELLNTIDSTKLVVYFDPILQENFQFTLTSSLKTILNGLENQVMLDQLFADMGYDEIPDHIASRLSGETTPIITKQATLDGTQKLNPNSTQHNVPAWSIFAMFFMVVSLGGNIVKERLSGSFVRLMTIPPSFTFTLISKMLVYVGVAVSQLFLLFCIGYFIFPFIGLPKLQLPNSIFQLVLISFLSGMAAVSYAVAIGTYAKSQEQANGFGAVSIVIFAAIGGIWVPTFVMPDYMQTVAYFSPLHWCLDGYYVLFLKNGDWNALSSSIIFLSLFIVVFQALTFIKLKIQNYI